MKLFLFLLVICVVTFAFSLNVVESCDCDKFGEFGKLSPSCTFTCCLKAPGNMTTEICKLATNPRFYQVSTIEIDSEDGKSVIVPENGINFDLIVNTFKQVWEFVKENKPVLDWKSHFGTAFPQGVKDAMELELWSDVQSQVFNFVVKNAFGIKTIDFKFAVNYIYNGRYSKGDIKEKGRYLSFLTVSPRTVSVLWGYKLKADVEIPAIVNAGTKENPVARAIMNLNFQFGTVLKEERRTMSFQIDGDGKFRNIA